MDRHEIALRVGVFVGLVIAAFLISAAGATSIGDGGVQSEPLTVESHQPDAILAAEPTETGAVPVSNAAADRTVVIDQSHNNTRLSDLDPFVEALVAAGHDVESYTGEDRSLDATLSEADAFVVVAPETPYNRTEIDRVQQFADDGGRVLLVREPRRAGGNETGMTELASTFGLGFRSGYLYDLDTYDVNHRDVYATPATDGPLSDDVERVTIHTGQPVIGGTPVYVSANTTALSTTRRDRSFSVVARQENVVAIGDRSILTDDYVYASDNEVLVGNVIEFLVSGSR